MSDNLIQSVIHFLRLHPYWGEAIAFIAAFSESLAIVGSIIPGSVTMTAVGTLIGSGVLPSFSTILFAIIGAITGDTLSFWIGKHYTDRVRYVWPFKTHPHWLERGEAFFERHGASSIIIGRFVGPMRSCVPLIAGLLKMSWPKFIAAAIPSAIMWAFAYMLPGILLGALSLELPPNKVSEFILFGILLILALWFVFWAIQFFFRWFKQQATALTQRTWNWLIRHDRRLWLVRILENKRSPTDARQFSLFIIFLITGFLFLMTFIDVYVQGHLSTINQPLFHLLQSLRSDGLDNFLVMVTLLGDKPAILATTACFLAWFAWRKDKHTFWHLLVLMLLTICAIGFFKLIYHSPRPIGILHVAESSSFPSGHVALSFSLYGMLAFLTACYLPKNWRWASYTSSYILIVLIAFSRLYLGAHWLTDVLGSVFLSASILLLVIISYRRTYIKRYPLKTWFTFFFGAIIIPWLIYAAFLFKSTKHDYSQYWPHYKISINDWWNHTVSDLPLYRLNRFGNPIQPLNVQWATPLTMIRDILCSRGWHEIGNIKAGQSTLQRFFDQQASVRLSLLPLQYHQYYPALIVYHSLPSSDSVVILRLWPSDVTFTNSNLPLWVGTLSYLIQPHELFTFKENYFYRFHNLDPLEQIYPFLDENYALKVLIVPQDDQPQNLRNNNWNGRILLIRKIADKPIG